MSKNLETNNAVSKSTRVNTNKQVLLKHLDMILSVVPDIWTHALITPSFRNGDGFDPNNYRTICVNSNLRKAFCTIIHSRLKHSSSQLHLHQIIEYWVRVMPHTASGQPETEQKSIIACQDLRKHMHAP